MRFTALDATPAHVRVRVGVGPDEDHLATAGIIMVRTEEWADMRQLLLVNLGSATNALRDLATLNECGDPAWVTDHLRQLADRHEQMHAEQWRDRG